MDIRRLKFYAVEAHQVSCGDDAGDSLQRDFRSAFVPDLEACDRFRLGRGGLDLRFRLYGFSHHYPGLILVT